MVHHVAIGRTVRPRLAASRKSTRNTESPSVLLLDLGQRRGAGEQQHEIRMLHPRDPHLLTADNVVIALSRREGLICVVSVPVVGSVTAKDCSRNSPDAMRGQIARFCSSEPWRSSVPMMYICAWHAPELAPDAIDLLQDHGRLGHAQSAAAILGRDQRREPPGVGERPRRMPRGRPNPLDRIQ